MMVRGSGATFPFCHLCSPKLMISPGQSSLHLTDSFEPPIVAQTNGQARGSASGLVFTQDEQGRYLSFYWDEAERYHLNPDQMIGKCIEDCSSTGLVPLDAAVYLSRVNAVLTTRMGDRFPYPLLCQGAYLLFDLSISPVLCPNQPVHQVVVLGTFLKTVTTEQAAHHLQTLPQLTYFPSVSRFQKPLTEVAWNIRRTLDLATIWKQTVDGLGRALHVDRCLICPYKIGQGEVAIAAEYRKSGFSSLREQTLVLARESYLETVLQTLKPVSVTLTDPILQRDYHLLALITSYQDEPNGLIILHQYDLTQGWSEVELELIQELADQVGTGIAHASLLSESRDLALELQQTNQILVKQHQELEEARQQAEEASRLKSEFLANTSHELRTPLNGMIGFLKLIMDGMADDPEEQEEFIQEAYRSAVHLLSIINDILDIAKIEAGKMQLELNPVVLDDLMNDLENFTSTQAQQKNLSFEILTPATRDEVVLLGNYQRLLQVMLNLVGNAIKFTHEGGITISAEVMPKKVMVQDVECPGMVKISVADTGIGVSLEKQDKLFQSFSQVDGSRTRQYGGTGLGLAISQKLVEAMGGIVNFYSMGEGLGSTVTFTVPLYQDPVMIAAPTDDTADLLV